MQWIIPSVCCAVACTCATLSAQEGARALNELNEAPATRTWHNAEQISTMGPAGRGERYSDVWGYVDPTTRREYALLCSTLGVHVLDCTDPERPVERGMIPTPVVGVNNIWRDVKTYSTYAYAVSEAHGGVQVIDLSDPDSPTLVQLAGATEWAQSHNIAIDEGTGYAFVCGTDRGTVVLDLADPANPVVVFELARPYAHDLAVRDGYAYVADPFGNGLLIFDVTQLPTAMPVVGGASAPGGGVAHSAWPSRDGTLCITTNEWPGGPVGVFDVTNKALPILVATYQANSAQAPQAVPHNVYVTDRVVHIAHFSEGYRVLDVSESDNPVEVGWYDTYVGSSVGLHGAWGVYAGLPSGNILVSDTEGGLHVITPFASVVRYGRGSTGSHGVRPRIFARGSAFLGNDRFELEADQAPPDRPGILVIGDSRANMTIQGVQYLVPLAHAFAQFNLATNAFGEARVPLAIPDNASLNGMTLTAQFLFINTADPFDYSASPGIEAKTFLR